MLNTDVEPDPPLAIEGVTVDRVSQMFPDTRRANIEANLPFVLGSLVEGDLADKPMVLMALATIRAETAGFVPIDEGRSRFKTGGDTALPIRMVMGSGGRVHLGRRLPAGLSRTAAW